MTDLSNEVASDETKASDGSQLVATIFGPMPQSQLGFKYFDFDEGNTLVTAREWYYTGVDPNVLEAVEKLTTSNHHVRRDVMVTIKIGLKAAGAQG